MSDNDFVYTTYIKTTPERLWKALTDPEFTQQYWGVQHETDWKVGSPMAWKLGDVTMAGPGQKVLEHDPYRRLAFTWHTITPEFAAGRRDERRPSSQRPAASRSPGSASTSNRTATRSASPSSTPASNPAARSAR